MNILNQLLNDEAGFIVSSELVLVSTIAVLSLVVGLAEISHNINQELEDVGSAFGQVNQTYTYSGSTGHKGRAVGSLWGDSRDECDGECDINCNSAPLAEGYH